MAEKMVNFRMDSTLKDNFSAVCEAMGMSTSTAFTIFAKKVISERKIPFEITADPFYCKENFDFLKSAKFALDSGKGVEHSLIED